MESCKSFVCACSPAAGRWGWRSGWGSSCSRRWRRCWTPGCAGPESEGGGCAPQSCYTPPSQSLHHQLRENNSMSSCAACRPYPYRPAKTIKPRRAEIYIHEAAMQKFYCGTVDPGLLLVANWQNPSVQFPWFRSRACWFPLQGDVRKENALITSRNSDWDLYSCTVHNSTLNDCLCFNLYLLGNTVYFFLMIIYTDDVHTIRSDQFLLFLPALLLSALTMLKEMSRFLKTVTNKVNLICHWILKT